jgi:hypothetical protein
MGPQAASDDGDEDWTRRADAARYETKSNGRNRMQFEGMGHRMNAAPVEWCDP